MSRLPLVLRLPLLLAAAALVFAVCIVVLTIGAALTSLTAAWVTVHANLMRRGPSAYIADGITSIEQHLAKETGQ